MQASKKDLVEYRSTFVGKSKRQGSALFIWWQPLLYAQMLWDSSHRGSAEVGSFLEDLVVMSRVSKRCGGIKFLTCEVNFILRPSPPPP
jgi:hypothetical protein